MTPEQALLETQTAVEMITVVIDGFEVTVPKGTLVIRAAEKLGIQIPRFCDHPLLEPAGACRQCLVDIEINGRAFPKPQASCTIPVENNMIVKTQLTSPVAEKAQAGIMEFLLINHPLVSKALSEHLKNQSRFLPKFYLIVNAAFSVLAALASQNKSQEIHLLP